MRKRLGEFDKVKADAVAYGEFIKANHSTYRKTADHFGVHHTRVQRYIKRLLPEINPELSKDVENVLAMNASQKHLRGGEATHQKFKG